MTDLAALAAQVRADHEAVRRGSLDALDRQLSIGRALIEARCELKQDREFGRWFDGQGFEFKRSWAWWMREAALREDEVRALVVAQVTTGKEPSIRRALATLRLAEKPPAPEPGPLPEGSYRCIVADPPWRYGNTATRGSAENHYPTMTVEDIANLGIAERAADEAHLYLWTTNSFMREAFDVVAAWGFEYKTLLTWVKPQIGLGNYFRNRTEHVLFGVRGGLSTYAKDVSNVIDAPRGAHSAKPDCFYDLVERQSPGPFLELFARRQRLGWDTWGNECHEHVALEKGKDASGLHPEASGAGTDARASTLPA